MTGTRRDGTAHHMRGVVVFGVRDGVAHWARFYLEPVDPDAGTVDDAVREQVVEDDRRRWRHRRLGTQLVTRLAARGLDVRVLTREPARARHLGDLAAEIIKCDVRDRASMESAMRGATTVVSAVHGSPAQVECPRSRSIVTATRTFSMPPPQPTQTSSWCPS